jgi:hypothetical protein
VANALAPLAVPSSRSKATVAVIPAPAASTFSRRMSIRPLTLPQGNMLIQRRVRRAANWLMFSGYINGLMGFAMLFFSGALPIFGAISILVATLTLIGAVKMKALQSYRWALISAYAALVPTSFCFPLTAIFGMRALTCLSDPQLRAQFPN